MADGSDRCWLRAAASISSLMLLGAAACTVRAADGDPDFETAEVVSEAIRTGCQGGFTGGGGGVRIGADDHVIAWTKATSSTPVEEVDSGPDPALAAEVRQRLDAIDFTAIAFDEPGNMTCFLTYRDHTVAWPMGDPNAPAAVVAIHDRLRGAN